MEIEELGVREREGGAWSEEKEELKTKVRKKRGPYKINKKESAEENSVKEQGKFFIDVSKDLESREIIRNLIQQANDKELGKEITLKDFLIPALAKITPKDIEKVQEASFSNMDKVLMKLKDHNLKNGTNYELGEYLTKVLRIE